MQREEHARRQRILNQIAQDRENNSKKHALEYPSKTKNTDEIAHVKQHINNSQIVRIQLKKPDGNIVIKIFNCEDNFGVLRSYVAENVLNGLYSKFSLANSFPRKEYTEEDDRKSMIELDLAPTATILVLPLEKTKLISQFQIFSILRNILLTIYNPILTIISSIHTFVFQSNQRDPNERNTSESDKNFKHGS